MSKNLKRARLAALVGVALSVAANFVHAALPLQACFVYVSPIGQAGWSYQHDRADWRWRRR